MYILSRWVWNSWGWEQQLIAASNSIDMLNSHESIDSKVIIVNNWHGHDPDSIKGTEGYHYTITDIDYTE